MELVYVMSLIAFVVGCAHSIKLSEAKTKEQMPKGNFMTIGVAWSLPILKAIGISTLLTVSWWAAFAPTLILFGVIVLSVFIAGKY